jgi:hypothetical protein
VTRLALPAAAVLHHDVVPFPSHGAMDLKIIEQKQLVERYLLGRLSPPEARFFEQLIRRSPHLAEQVGLPETLKRTMQLLDETGTEWRETPPRFWHKPGVPLGLAGALALAVTLAVGTWLGKRELAAEHTALRQEALRGLLNAPAQQLTLRVTPGRVGERVPTVSLGSRSTPSMAELRIDTSYVRGNLYKATVKREDGTFWARFDNLLRDSNGELRLAINSGAFAAGTYDVAIESVNLRGDGTPIGTLRLRVDPN